MIDNIRLKSGFELIRTFDNLLEQYSSYLDLDMMKTELKHKILSMFSSNPVYFYTTRFKNDEGKCWLIDLEHTSDGPCGMITFWEEQQPIMTVLVSKNERFVTVKNEGVWIDQDHKLLLSKEEYRPKCTFISDNSVESLSQRFSSTLSEFLVANYDNSDLNFDFDQIIFQTLQYILESGQFILILYQASWFRHAPFLFLASEYNRMEKKNYFAISEVTTSNVGLVPGEPIDLVIDNVQSSDLLEKIAEQIRKDLTTFH